MTAIATRVLDRPPAAWTSLLESDPAATPAHRPELWDVLRHSLGFGLRFMAVEDEGVLIGGGAVFVERRAGLHWLHALPFLLPGAPLARDGRHAEVDFRFGEALGGLQRELGAAGGEWAACRSAGAAVGESALACAAGETRRVETSLLGLDDGVEAVWRRLPRDTRTRIRYARVSGLRCEEEPTAVEEIYALHLAQSRDWSGHRPLPLELSRRLLAAQGPGGPLARLFVVRDARRPLAGTLMLDHPRECFVWWSGARDQGRDSTRFLMWSIVEWAARAGRSRFNLGGSSGNDALLASKRSLGARPFAYPVRWLDASRAAWPARVAAMLQRRLRARRFQGSAT